MKPVLLTIILGAFVIWPGVQQPFPPARQIVGPSGVVDKGTVEIQMRNVNFRVSADVVLEIGWMRGRLVRTRPDTPVNLDDPGSFFADLDSAHVAMSPESLSSLMNTYVLAYPGAPIRKISIGLRGDRLIQKGIIHKAVDLPFEIEGSLSVSPTGEIRVHAEKIRSAHVPLKALLHLFGEDLSKLVNQSAGKGMSVSGDDIILDPQKLTPPPHLRGHLTKILIARGKVVQIFDAGRHLPPLDPPLRASAYIYHRGGVLCFGKLTMNDAELEIVGDRPGRFDFFEREYRKQLVAGYSKTTPANGLVAHMLDYSRLSSGR